MLAGMFGSKRPVFSDPSTQPFGTPPIAPSPMETAPGGMPMGVPQMPAQQSQASPFDHLSPWKAALGGLFDSISQQTGGQASFVPAMIQHQRQQAEIAQQQQQRQQALQDGRDTWLQQQEWERAHPKPINNDTVNDYNFIMQKRGEDRANQYLDNFSAGPPMAVDAIDPVTHQTVRQYIPRTALPGMTGAAPQAGPAPGTVEGGYRFKGGNPADASAWEPVGGAAPSGTATFRR